MKIREQLIIDLTEKYKRDYNDEYKLICKDVKRKRQKLFDKKSGLVKDRKMRVACRIPQTLFAWIDTTIDNPGFMDDPKELKWFLKKYPEFKIPNEY